jgi:hypothetical protein
MIVGRMVAADSADVKPLASAGAALIHSRHIMRSAPFILIALVGIVVAAASCRRESPSHPAHAPATLPGAPAATSIDSERYGIHLDWPQGWTPRHSDDFVLELVPSDRGESAGGASTISLDVPSLPPHLPGMIKIGLVANGFLDDLKKEQKSLQVVEQKDVVMPDATARRISTKWKGSDGTEYVQDALLIVHKDRVYIIRGTAPGKDAQSVHDAFERVLGSLKWM